jgi:hypothetical protein
MIGQNPNFFGWNRKLNTSIMAWSTSTNSSVHVKHASTLKESESDGYGSSHNTSICTLVHWSRMLNSGSTPTRRTAASGIPLGWRTRRRPRPVLLLHAPGPPAANRCKYAIGTTKM